MTTEGLFELLCCLQLTGENFSHRNTRIGQPSIGIKSCGRMNHVTILYHANGRMRKHRSHVHEYSPSCWWGSIMVWCGTTSEYDKYRSWSSSSYHVMPYPKGHGYLMRHGALLVLCRSGFGNIFLMWPTQTTDLNQTKHLWGAIELIHPACGSTTINLTSLNRTINQAWCHIPRINFQHLVQKNYWR